MKNKKPIKKCNDCPPDECCHCKDKMKLKKKKKSIDNKVSDFKHEEVISSLYYLDTRYVACSCGDIYTSRKAFDRHIEDCKPKRGRRTL